MLTIFYFEGMAEVEKTKRKRKRKNNGNSKMAKMDLEREKKFIDKEEKEIKKYEKLLKLKSYTKRNKLPKSFYYDGLGELLEFCDNKQYSNRVVTDEGEEDAFAELRNRKPKQVQPKAKAAESDHEEDDDDEDDDSFDEDDEEMEMDEADEEVEDEKGEAEELSDNDEEGQDDDFENKEEEEEEEHEKPKKSAKKESKSGYREDIYGFLRDKDGNIVKSEAEQRSKEDFLNSNVVVEETLQRKLRGLVNRLTANNIKVISNEILALYKGHSRAVINQGILNVFDRVIIKVDYIVPVKLVAEMAMLVAILHSEIGEEVGAFFIHSAVRHFDALFSDTSTWNDTKQLNNTVIFILNLYTAGLVDSVIVYDIIDKFCEQFSQEKSIEIIDLMLKASGFQLRKDDPVRMKSLIMAIQQLSSSVDQSGLSGTRIRFVLESLTAIKNNNMAKLKVKEPVVMGELIESTLKGVIKKPRVQFIPGQYATVIQSAHWFSFTANIVPLEAIKGGGGSEEAKQEEEEKVTTSAKSLDKLVDYRLRDQLCKKLRINTPLRRDLFTALFACNDYLDAACKLVSIGKKQFSEVVNVVLHVAVNEKTYNPFYYHLLQHLTTCDRKYKVRYGGFTSLFLALTLFCSCC